MREKFVPENFTGSLHKIRIPCVLEALWEN